MEHLRRSGKTNVGRGGGVRGGKGLAARADQDSIGWLGQQRATPSAPAGGGGPGNFALQGPQISESPSVLQEPLLPRPLQVSPVPQPPNPPPATNPRSLGSQKSVQTNHADVAIIARIVADGTDQNIQGARTSFSAVPPSTSPGFQTDASGNITSFTGKFVGSSSNRVGQCYRPTPSG